MAGTWRRLLRWDRSDTVVLTWVLQLAIVVVALVGLAGPAWELTRGGEAAAFTVPVELEADAYTAEAPAGTVAPFGAHVPFDVPDLSERLLHLGPSLVGATLTLWGLILVLGIVRSLRTDTLFTLANTRRLTVLALLLIVGSTLTPLVGGVARAELLQRTALSDVVVFRVEWSLLPVLLGFGVAALAEVFRRGTALQVDLEGVI